MLKDFKIKDNKKDQKWYYGYAECEIADSNFEMPIVLEFSSIDNFPIAFINKIIDIYKENNLFLNLYLFCNLFRSKYYGEYIFTIIENDFPQYVNEINKYRILE